MSKFAFDPPVRDEMRDRHTVAFHNNEAEGEMVLREHDKGKTLHVVYAGAHKKGAEGDAPHVLGHSEVRQALAHIKKHFPKATTIQGNRTSGARYAGLSDEEYLDKDGPVGQFTSAKLR